MDYIVCPIGIIKDIYWEVIWVAQSTFFGKDEVRLWRNNGVAN